MPTEASCVCGGLGLLLLTTFAVAVANVVVYPATNHEQEADQKAKLEDLKMARKVLAGVLYRETHAKPDDGTHRHRAGGTKRPGNREI